jgi:hypothetical protein
MSLSLAATLVPGPITKPYIFSVRVIPRRFFCTSTVDESDQTVAYTRTLNFRVGVELVAGLEHSDL